MIGLLGIGDIGGEILRESMSEIMGNEWMVRG